MRSTLLFFACLLCSYCHSFIYDSKLSGWRIPRSRSDLQMGRASNVRKATKARTDAAKSKNNNRYARKIIVAVKAGGPDPVSNQQLAHVIADAKVANVPKEIITRNIESASSANTLDFKESMFEFYGHGGVGMLVYVLTDNDNRAASMVNLVAKKHLLKPAAMNSVKFKFNRKVRFDVHSKLEEDSLMELCLENNVDDYTLRTAANGCVSSPAEDGHSSVFVNLNDLSSMREALAAKKYVSECRLVSVPVDGCVSLDDASFEANMAAIDAFEALDDVDVVEHNIDLKDD